MTDAEKWAEYEAQKKKLQRSGMTAAEYEAALKAVLKRLRL